MKPHLPVTLCAVDTSPTAVLAARAIEKSLEQCSFDSVKLLTDDLSLPYAVPIPKLRGIADYSNFVTRELHRFIDTPHVLLIQSDGYVLSGKAWDPHFLTCDYIGPPWNQFRLVGNGGFTLRSKKLLEATAKLAPEENTHPEDQWICHLHRTDLIRVFGIRFAEVPMAAKFGYEGRYLLNGHWLGLGTPWDESQFGFHSWLTKLPDFVDRPRIFHHSGDAGDVIYALPTIKALGGGVLVLTPENKYPYPSPSRWQQNGAPVGWVDNLGSLLEDQPYIWKTLFSSKMPPNVDHDLNAFRGFYAGRNVMNFKPLAELHLAAFGLSYDRIDPWLSVRTVGELLDKPIVINRTSRFHGPGFPWQMLVNKYGRQMLFLGLPEEHARFCQEFGCRTLSFVGTKNLRECAQLIAGARVFIGNQSCPLSIALGLGKNCIVETWIENPNCMIPRSNVIHWRGGHCDIPPHWL